MSNELKPCPFCGNKSIWLEDIDVRGMDSYYAVCVECGAKSGYEDTPEKATEKWNARAERTCHALPPTVNRICTVTDVPTGFSRQFEYWRCSECGTNNVDGAWRCMKCGAKLKEVRTQK